MTSISIIIPTYNQAQYMPICLDSAWFQDYTNLEIIVVNDGSPDNTRNVLATYQKSLVTDQVSYASHYNEQTGEVERCNHPR